LCTHTSTFPAGAATGPQSECQQCESAVISQQQPSRRHHVAANGNSLPAGNIDTTLQQQNAVRKIRAVLAMRNTVPQLPWYVPTPSRQMQRTVLCSEAENKPPAAHGAVAQQLSGLVSRELLLRHVD